MFISQREKGMKGDICEEERVETKELEEQKTLTKVLVSYALILLLSMSSLTSFPLQKSNNTNTSYTNTGKTICMHVLGSDTIYLVIILQLLESALFTLGLLHLLVLKIEQLLEKLYESLKDFTEKKKKRERRRKKKKKLKQNCIQIHFLLAACI